MKQLSSSELNNFSSTDLAAMVLQMQQINTLNEKIAIMNARRFGNQYSGNLETVAKRG